MSKFLEIPSCATTPMCLHRETLFYILDGFIQEAKQNIRSSEYPPGDLKGQETKLIQLLIDKSNQKLRMYGSAQELLENINIFKNFPANHKLFGAAEEPYQTRPTIFKSLKDEEYIAKQDLFVILQNIILTISASREWPIELVHLFAYYLKAREENVEKCVEFVKFDKKFIDSMKNRLTEAMGTSQHSPAKHQQLVKEFSKLNLPQIIAKFEHLIPSKLNPDQHQRLQVFLGRFFNSMPLRNRNDGMLMSYLFASLIIESLETVVDENLEMFSPRHQDSKQPVTVRVFEDGDQQFLMKTSLKSVVLETITMEQFLDNYGTTNNIEFIRYPITRAKHRATPIQGPSGTDKNKKEKFLRTCDLFDAIEHCQLICILERSLNLRKFVHNQKGCHRVYGFVCGFCLLEKLQTLAIQDSEGPSGIH
ncbi:hypothetical protein L5515_013208 [Caenorhabditis briggsae]|uniref:DUF7809 domain-containing protein n=1 Tax=Caenorhabditis briggsae TaxID=6238 RepID=A0AAE9J6N5_CAEBR|nr:hypothetical protein L5515_013208 [Caenorhabditis briggsae]